MQPLLDVLFGQQEYGFVVSSPDPEEILHVKVHNIFGAESARCQIGSFLGSEDRPGVYLNTCTHSRTDQLAQWSSFFCLLMQQEVEVAVIPIFRRGVCRLTINTSLDGGVVGLLRSAGIRAAPNYEVAGVTLLVSAGIRAQSQ